MPDFHSDPRIPAARADDQLDDALLSVARGDVASYEVVYGSAWARLYSRALAVLRSPDLAEEVAQEALAEVWLHAGRFDPRNGSAMA